MISERERVGKIDALTMDGAWARGWRHFGPDFFRDSLSFMGGEICRVTPLRVLLNEWSPSKSERRTLRKNEIFTVEWHSPRMDSEENELFQIHKERFTENVPMGLENFLGWSLQEYPCEMKQCSVFQQTEDGLRLVAFSYLDLGEKAVSSVYGVFHPELSRYRLGIYTMLQEMLYAQEQGYDYYYSGYATIESSSYDYKKQFTPQEYYQWGEEWFPLEK